MNCSQCEKEISPEKQITIEDKEDWCYDCYKASPKTICVDFDGVLAEYIGWKGPDHLGDPMPGALGFLKQLCMLNYEIVIHTTRNPSGIIAWTYKYGVGDLIHKITNRKVPAVAYIDDRAIPFLGNFSDTLMTLQNFKPYWKEDK